MTNTKFSTEIWLREHFKSHPQLLEVRIVLHPPRELHWFLSPKNLTVVTQYTQRKSNIISDNTLTSPLFFSLISCLFNRCKQLSAHHLFEQPNQNNYKCMLHYNNCILTKAWGQLIITPSISNLHKTILFKDSMFGVTGLPHWLCKFPIKLCRSSQKK